MTTSKLRPPAGLGSAGRELWAALTARLEFESHELPIVALACRQADDIAALERSLAADGLIVTGSTGQPRLNAVVGELRQGRLALAKLIAELGIPDDPGGQVLRPAQKRAKRAAESRWGKAGGAGGSVA